MPGDNCSVCGCGSNRRMKGIGIFKLPSATTEKRKIWRSEILNEITKSRVVDPQFREQIKNDKVYMLEKFPSMKCFINSHPDISQNSDLDSGRPNLRNVRSVPWINMMFCHPEKNS